MVNLHSFGRALAAVLLAASIAAAAEPPAIADLFRLPQYADMKVSPDGKRVAALAPVNGRRNLVVIELSPRQAKPVTAFDNYDVLSFEWINDRRFLVSVGALNTMQAEQPRGQGLLAIDADGTSARSLFDSVDPFTHRSYSARATVRWFLPVRQFNGDTDEVVLQEWVYAWEGAKAGGLYRFDTRTGARTRISDGAPDSAERERWIVDAKGVARVQVASSKGRVRIHYRAGPDAPWSKLAEHSTTEPSWSPLAIADDGKTLVVSDLPEGDRQVLRAYDPARKEMGEVLAAHPQVDLDNVIVEGDRVLGVRYRADRRGTAWFDPTLARIQRGIDAALPDTENTISWSRDRTRIVVKAASDVSPGTFYLLDTKAGKLEFLADAAPWLDAKKLSPTQAVRYPARDGLVIPAYVTAPRGGGKRPLVVVVHGGPWVSGAGWTYDPEAQFFASRGYTVLQPNFRGTTRYGWKHYRASFGEWGRTMQDDIEDGVRWAVAQGIADPERVCIYGASYGGYSAMMGLIRTPKLYRCGVNAVGVTDLDLFMDATWTDYARSDSAEYTLVQMMGDRSRFEEVNPVAQARRIESPVLLAYGSEDRRVPIEHGTRMRSALDKAGKPYEWMLMEGEGHGFFDPKNIEAYYRSVEAFLARHLKPAEAKPEPAGKLP